MTFGHVRTIHPITQPRKEPPIDWQSGTTVFSHDNKDTKKKKIDIYQKLGLKNQKQKLYLPLKQWLICLKELQAKQMIQSL